MTSFKRISLSLAVASALSFSGCGGGGNSSSNNNTTPTDIKVERGKVYDSLVTDSDGKKAKQKDSTNIYTFVNRPKYPITATGGWIDVDNDGKKTSSDIHLDLVLTSYSNVITPITTYISNADESIREKRMKKLMDVMKVTKENLLKVPSKSSAKSIILTNALFKIMKEKDTIDIDSHFDDITTSFKSLTTTYNQSGSGKSLLELSKFLEKIIIDDLDSQNKIKRITKEEIKQIVKISGSIPTDKIAYIPNTMDKMLAYIGIQPLYADYVGTANKIIVITPDYKIVKKDLNADGTFSIDLDTSTSSAIFLVNDTTKEVVGSVSIPVSSGSDVTLDMMPKGKITKNLDLGELTFNIEKGIATTKSVNIEKDLGDDSETKIMAKLDDATKIYANAYRNKDYRLLAEWQFKFMKNAGDDNISLSQVDGKFIDINSTKLIFEGVKPTLVSQHKLTSPDVKVYFPIGNKLKISYQPIDINGDTTINSDTYYGMSNFILYSDSGRLVLNNGDEYISSKVAENLPSGEYKLKIDGNIEAQFDMVSTSPFGNQATSPIINKAPLVLVKLNTDPTDDEKFISVTWKFVRHNGTSYVDLSDSEVRLWMGVSSAELECNLFENDKELAYAKALGNEITGNNITKTFQLAEDKPEVVKPSKTSITLIDTMIADTSNDYIYNYFID